VGMDTLASGVLVSLMLYVKQCERHSYPFVQRSQGRLERVSAKEDSFSEVGDVERPCGQTAQSYGQPFLRLHAC
jgi:hypothetical protein